MHIYEGILSATPTGQGVLAAGMAATALGTAIGLRRLDEERIPRAAVLGATFFVVSAIQVPLFGVTSAHLVLGGLMGLVLGWAAFPTVLVGLVLQMAFCSLTGPAALGINTLIMALPAVACHYLFGGAVRGDRQPVVFAAAAAAGATAIVLGALLSSAALVLAGNSYTVIAAGFLATHLPLAAVEAVVTGSIIVLVRQVRPEMLRAAALAPAAQEGVDG